MGGQNSITNTFTILYRIIHHLVHYQWLPRTTLYCNGCRGQPCTAIKAQLVFYVKLSNVADIIDNTQIGENFVNIGENLPSQIPASFDHAALNRRKLVKRNKQLAGDLATAIAVLSG